MNFSNYLLPYLTAVVMGLALLFGGGTQQALLSDAVVEIASLPLLIVSGLQFGRSTLPFTARIALFLMLTIISLPILQLIPLPPEMWRLLPSRERIYDAYIAAEMSAPWLPISLDPISTWRGLLFIVPGTSIFIATLFLSSKQRLILVILTLLVAAGTIVLEILQILGGPNSPLRFYAITNVHRAVGLFANSNHTAAFLYCSIVYAIELLVLALYDPRRPWPLPTLALMAAFILAILLGIILSQSRAGLLLAFLGIGISAIGAMRLHPDYSARSLYFILGGFLVIAIFSFQFGFATLVDRFYSGDIARDFRWSILAVTWRVAWAFLPFGTGTGIFVQIFEEFEPRESLGDKYVNHAHNDWLELVLNGGAVAVAIMLAFAIWFVVMVFKTRSASVLGSALRGGALISVILLLVHSALDYPLRTAAVSCIFALSCGIIARPDDGEAKSRFVGKSS